MSENKKFILVAIIIFIIFTGEKVWKKTRNFNEKEEKNYVVRMEKHTYKQVDELLDINTANLEDMLRKKVSMSYAEKILDYVDVTGGFESIEELKRIPGIGEKTYEKLKVKFIVVETQSKNKVNINKATKQEMTYIGFTKQEIKKVEKYLEENRFIFDNIVFLELMGEERYSELKEKVRYD